MWGSRVHPGNHRTDGPKAYRALTIRLDHSTGADHHHMTNYKIRYGIFGGFEVPQKAFKKRGKVFDDSKCALKQFWDAVDEACPGLSNACGCYVFAVRTAKGIKPWYVGQTKKSFKEECYEPTKRNHYHGVFHKVRSGTPILIFVARRTEGGRFSRKLKEDEADFVEKRLIGLALKQNPDLCNIQNTQFIRDIQIPGILNSPPGKPTPATAVLRMTMGT